MALQRRRNNVLRTDSYKLGHHGMLPLGTKRSNMHFASRVGSGIPWTKLFGLQYTMVEYLAGEFVTRDMLDEALAVGAVNMPKGIMDEKGWRRIIDVHGGRLPVEIRAVPEGLRVPRGEFLFDIENTDEQLPGLPGHLESLLMKVWYPTAVATRGSYMYERFLQACKDTGTDEWWAQFMLQDFGYRGNATEEGAEIGGAAHLVGSRGTDTLIALPWLRDYYGAPLEGLGMSVQASQHEVMTATGRLGEHGTVRRLIAENAGRTLSLVGDSYDYHAFVDFVIGEYDFIQSKKVQLVIRPDSTTPLATTKADVVRWTLDRMRDKLPKVTTATRTGHLQTPYKVLYGDGFDGPVDVFEVLDKSIQGGYAAGSFLFGMGGGIHQKVDRDTFRNAIKSGAQLRDGSWVDVSKDPLDQTKRSRAGRNELRAGDGEPYTARREDPLVNGHRVISRPVFRNGLVLAQQTFDEVRMFQ